MNKEFIKAVNETATMTSSELAIMLGKEKKHINEAIRLMFQDKIDGRVIRPSLVSKQSA